MKLRRLPVIIPLVTALLLTSALGFSGVSSAQTVSITQRITVTAYVAPASYIIVDDQDAIIRIDSNTHDDVTPKVYVHQVAEGNAHDLTPEIYASYTQKVPAGTNRIGTIYERGPLSAERLIVLNRDSALVNFP